MYELASCERRMHEGCALGRGEVARISSRAVENGGKRRVVHLEDARAGVTREVDLGAVPISATERAAFRGVRRQEAAGGAAAHAHPAPNPAILRTLLEEPV